MATDIVTLNEFRKDGKVIHSETTVLKRTSKVIRTKSEYFALQNETITELFLLTGTELKLFLFLSSKANYLKSDNIVDISRAIRKEAIDTLKISESTLRNTLCSLRKKKVLASLGSSQEMLSPLHVMSGKIDKVATNRKTFKNLVGENKFIERKEA
jgi:hypothetical protein